jgi:PAS domain S-box-containing protein
MTISSRETSSGLPDSSDRAPEVSAVKILLVDDEPKNLLALEAVLAGDGRTLRHASSGAEALMHLLQEDFAVILLDVNMPEMDGFETAAMIRQRAQSHDTPIIFLTAAIRGETYVARGYALGAVDYIFKPFEPEILRSKVAVFVQLFKKTEEIKLQAQQLIESTLFLKSVFDSSTEYSIVALDLEGHVAAWNEGAHRMHGYTAQQIVGKHHFSMVFAADEGGRGSLQQLLETARSRGNAEGVFQLVRRNGERFTGSTVVGHRRDADGTPIGYVAITQDITGRLRAEQERLRFVEAETAHAEAEVARERLAFLAEASQLLTASLDSDLTLEALTHYVVPVLADVCLVDLIDSQSGGVRRVAVACASPTTSDVADHLKGIAAPVEALCGVGRVLSAPEAHEILGGLAPVSAVIVPLKTRGTILGAMTLVSTDSGRHYLDADLALASDLADRAAIALDNARLYGDAQRAIQLRDDFLSSASHDLKNPLTVIKGGADILHRRASQSTEPEAQRSLQTLSRISQAATKMVGLINEILDLAQLKAGHELALDYAPTDLVTLTRSIVGDFGRNSGHELKVETSDVQLTGDWDAGRIERVIGNLLNNALKYSPAGSHIDVCVSREDSAGEGWAVLSVKDEGVGIPLDELPRVFDRFYRGRNVVGKVQGTGIGLAGVRQIVEQHRGRVSIASTEDEGTTITVRIPLAAAPSSKN